MPYLVDIIFLDIDGVLLPFGGNVHAERRYTQGCIFPDCTMDALTTLLQRANNICRQGKRHDNDASSSSSSCKLVLSSTWRVRPDFIQDILSSFRAYTIEKSIKDPTIMSTWASHLDSFFDITDPNFHSTRHDEIYKWVQTNATTTAYTNNNARENGKKDFIVRSWIALDDEDLVNVEGKVSNGATKDHAVLTKSSVGLTLDDVSLGIHLLERQCQLFYTEVKY